MGKAEAARRVRASDALPLRPSSLGVPRREEDDHLELVLQILLSVLAPQVLPGCSGDADLETAGEWNAAKTLHEVWSASHRCELHGCCCVSAFLDMFGLPTIAANIVGTQENEAADTLSKFY